MYARTITFDARPESLEDGISYIRYTAFDTVMSMPGCLGMSFVVDRAGGRCIATSSWESEQAMRDSMQALTATRERGAEVFGSPEPQIAEWEVVVMHRAHVTPEAACVRATWVEGGPADIDRNIDFTRTTTLPQVEQLPGFCSASLLVNRGNGRAIFTAAYDTQADLEATRDRADGLRATYAEQTRSRIVEVREFELVLAHLHAPELV